MKQSRLWEKGLFDMHGIEALACDVIFCDRNPGTVTFVLFFFCAFRCSWMAPRINDANLHRVGSHDLELNTPLMGIKWNYLKPTNIRAQS